ncbi:MlaC/ttg2D family ABC transporter substrate-binding protein [Thalassovita aquimarina]|uniref:ABC transporter substrate-binding protein n=1 Tax=Thalassovita aquimarina TaxID=2785917 RepID=A0ABS5HVB0_9RHOB|nr:ABC transporter substrate-binding protein [Thalassovita aquimarina]MBR9652911.1 ABC transporter substrate-binding protein [Thalassovita aquimarina]
MLNNPSRRSFLSQISAVALAAAVPMPAFALSASSAKSLVDKLVADINAVIDSGKSESAMYKEFERIFARYADVPTIARYALGVDARSASAAQMHEFTKVFQRYISVKYGKRFREFIGGKIVVNSARAIKSFIEVKTTAHLRGEKPFEVVFLVSDRSGSARFFNLFIEGINMLLTERTEIGAMLDQRRGDLNAVIADLRKLS